MKKLFIFVLLMVLLLVSISPALAGNGNGGGGRGNGGGGGRGNGHGRNGNTNNQQSLGTGGNGYGWQFGSNVITGVIAKIDGNIESGFVTLTVYGGKVTSLYDNEFVVQTDDSTRFLLKDFGAITFVDLKVGDSVSVAIGSDGVADRITVGIVCARIPE